MPAETIRLRIANLSKAVLVTGQAYQEPKDALNEFVSNAADEYVEAGLRGERISVHLRRRGRHPLVAVSDDGRGLAPDRLRALARNLFESAKAGDDRTLGEKAIGILAFQQLGARCDIVSRAEGAAESWCLRLARGQATAQLGVDRRRPRALPGTTVYIGDLDPEVLRVLTLRKVVDYLRSRRGPALERGEYEIEVVEGNTSEVVVPQRPDGVRLDIPARTTLWGRIEFALWVAPRSEASRRVALVGRAGTTILDDITEIEDFAHPPWRGGFVAGMVAFPALQQTAGRRAVLRDRDAFPLLLDAVQAVEPAVLAAVERVSREVDERTNERLADAVRRIFSRVLRELEEIANPMRTQIGSEIGDDALLEAGGVEGEGGAAATGSGAADTAHPPEIDEPLGLELRAEPEPPPGGAAGGARASGRHTRLPSLLPDPDPGEARSRFDADTGVVLYNAEHEDYLLVKEDEHGLLDYLTQLVAKEYVVYNNPRAPAANVAEEMVRMLVRLRRHVGPPPRRRPSA